VQYFSDTQCKKLKGTSSLEKANRMCRPIRYFDPRDSYFMDIRCAAGTSPPVYEESSVTEYVLFLFFCWLIFSFVNFFTQFVVFAFLTQNV
jgi:hypothetical protein